MVARWLMISIFSLIGFAAFAGEGGGSSTGGGHVRVCLTPSAAKKAQKNIRINTETPQIAVDPFAGIKEKEILSVELLDLVEQPMLLPKLMPRLKQIADISTSGGTRRLSNIELIKGSAHVIFLRLMDNGSAFHHEGEFLSYVNDVIADYTWNPTQTGLNLTSDFDPKITNPVNCVFAQAVRQDMFADAYSTLDYDERLINKMSPEHLVALGVHEAAYNVILNSPRRNSINNTSVKARQLTILLLATTFEALTKNALTGSIVSLEKIALLLESIGYGPFDDMVRSPQRISRRAQSEAETAKFMKQCEQNKTDNDPVICDPVARDGYELTE